MTNVEVVASLPGAGSAIRHEFAALRDDDLAQLLMIRHFEQNLLRLFAAGEVAGTTHTCIGQEYVPVAIAPLAAPAFVFSNHRCHGHYLAQFADPAGLLAEITGREGAVCGGRGGSQHLYRENFCSTGVQGESVPVALGVAMHFRRTGGPGIALAYIGDGTWGQGVVYEALNMAQLWRAPLVVVVENNGIAQTTATARAMAGTVAARAAAFGIRYVGVTSRCVAEIRRQLAEPIQDTHGRGGPLVVEFFTQRLGPHSKGDDTREAGLIAQLQADDWYTGYARQHPEQFRRIDRQQREAVERVSRDVLARPLAGRKAAE